MTTHLTVTYINASPGLNAQWVEGYKIWYCIQLPHPYFTVLKFQSNLPHFCAMTFAVDSTTLYESIIGGGGTELVPPQTGPYTKSHQVSVCIYLWNCLIIFKFCTEHGSYTAMLCAKIENDQSSEMAVLFATKFCEILVSVREILYIVIASWFGEILLKDILVPLTLFNAIKSRWF